MSNFKKLYNETIKQSLKEELKLSSIMEVPKLEKIVINMGVGEGSKEEKFITSAVNELTLITGQKPVITKAKKSIAGFKLREGNHVGAKVTLRGEMMYDFLERLIKIAIPRIRDFHGVSKKAFDGKGNYTLGIKEQLIFPEVNYDEVLRVRGMDIVFVTSANTDEEAKRLLESFGMPFVK
jgi:large subunit ribosomal protein L5